MGSVHVRIVVYNSMFSEMSSTGQISLQPQLNQTDLTPLGPITTFQITLTFQIIGPPLPTSQDPLPSLKCWFEFQRKYVAGIEDATLIHFQ